jgi:Fe-S oxidoreductase
MKLYGLTSVVDPDLCIGCGRCEEVCAYRAIKNVFSKNKQTVSQVDHNACASCSACVSECPSGAISQGFMSDDDILKRITDKKTPYKGIKALMSFWSTMTPVLESKEGIVQLMSARKPSPSFLIRALSNSGRGLLVIKPDEITGSHYLPWEEHPDDVIDRTLKLLDSIGISRKRIKYLEKSNALDTKKLLEKYSKELDNNCLNHLNLPKLKNIKSPLGKTIALLRIMSANPDLEPTDEYNTLEQIKKGGNAFFEGCIPLINSVGVAHNFYDISKTRESIYELIKILELNLGKIKGFNCPSKGLLKLDWKESDKLVRKIKENNIKIYDKLKPKSIAVATPEASLSFSKDKRFGEIKNFPEILLKKIDSQKLNKINLTIGIHHACRLDEDPFYEPIKKILNKIPGIKTVDLKNLCGQSGFEELNAKSKQKAVSLLKEASSKGADIILCTSPYCQSHLLLCHREGSWRAVDIEISDIYRILLASINGDM